MVTTEWSICSASCGKAGTQYQLYYCAQEQDGGQKIKVDELFCSDLPDPKEPRPCNRLPCVEYKWVVTDDWEDCSESCGGDGTQRRKLQCQRRIGDDSLSFVGVRHCLDLEQPVETRNCNRRPCYGYKWEESDEWSDCSATCNEGIKQKLIVCKNVTYDDFETHIDESFCDESERPDISVPCNYGPCVIFQWVDTDNWTECSAECGISGTRTRIIECHQLLDGELKIVDDTFCSELDKDIQDEPCNRKPCYSFEWDIDEWSPCSNSCESHTSAQTRKVNCIQKYLSGQFELTESFFCDESTKPMSERACEVTSCSVYMWDVTDKWGDCSETCGDSGLQTQLSQCIEDFGNGTVNPINSTMCAHLPPNTNQATRTCELLPCAKYRYVLIERNHYHRL